jgi:transformation/transcription domain-associated protein
VKGFYKCQNPKIDLPIDVVAFIGRNYNVWHLAIKSLEDKLIEGRFTSPQQEHECYVFLSDIYRSLCEDDLFFGLWTKRATVDDTKAALVLQQHGLWQRGQELLYQAMIAEQQDTLRGVPEWEQTLWEEQWLESAKRLSQWELISEYAQTIRHQELLAEASAKIGDWVLSESLSLSLSLSLSHSFTHSLTLTHFLSNFFSWI